MSVVVYNCCFLQKPVQQPRTDMQFDKGGRGLLREANRSEGESVVGRKRVGWKENILSTLYSHNSTHTPIADTLPRSAA